MKYYYPLSVKLKLRILEILRMKKAYNNYRKRLMYENLNKEAGNILEIVNNLTSKRGMDYWLTWGTLLGAYREHGIIMGDNDLDLGMFYEDITVDFVDELISHGFIFEDAIVDKDYNGYHIAFNYKNVKVDFYSFLMNKDNNSFVGFAPGPNVSWSYSKKVNKCLVKKFYFPYKGLKKMEFMGTLTNVPSNDEELLKILYGDNFMTPIPGYKATANKNIVIEDVCKSYASWYSYEEFVELKNRGVI